MKLHERFRKVEAARLEIASLLLKEQQSRELTDWEMMRVLTEFIQSTIKYAIREERHGPDSELKGDEAADDE